MWYCHFPGPITNSQPSGKFYWGRTCQKLAIRDYLNLFVQQFLRIYLYTFQAVDSTYGAVFVDGRIGIWLNWIFLGTIFSFEILDFSNYLLRTIEVLS